MRGRAALLLLFHERRSVHRSAQEGQGPRDAGESGEHGPYVAARPELLV